MMNLLKKLMLFRLLVLVIQLKKLAITEKIGEIEKKTHDPSKYITTPEFNSYWLLAENFAERLKEAKLANESDISNFAKEKDFDEKLTNINKNVTLNKSKHVLVENELNELSEKVKLLSKKGYNFLFGRTYFTSDYG